MKRTLPILALLISVPVLHAVDYEAGVPEPTHAEVSYGPHERNVLDFWQAKLDKPNIIAIRSGNLKYMPDLGVADGWYGTAKKKPDAAAHPALFDLSKDLGETQNLPNEKASESKRLAGLLAKAKSSPVTRPE